VLSRAAGAEEEYAEGAVAVELQERAQAERKRNQEHHTSQRQEAPHRRCPLCVRRARAAVLSGGAVDQAVDVYRHDLGGRTVVGLVPSDGSRFSLVLTLQIVVGAILGVAAQAFVFMVVIGYVMPWFGLGLLDMARDVAAFNLPLGVSQRLRGC
jgi:hypothetical protein